MPTQQDYDKAIWLAYCDAIKGGSWGNNTAVFFATEGQIGPAAGKDIDEAYSNQGYYQLGDNLLKGDSLFYTPSQANSFIRAVGTYLDYVDIGAAIDNSQLGNLKTAYETQAASQAFMAKAKAQAVKDWKDDVTNGFVPATTSLPEWLTTNGGAYNSAVADYNAATSKVQLQEKMVYGPQADSWALDKQRVQDAQYNINPIPGINMRATTNSAPDAATILNTWKQSGTLPPPTQVTYVPLYAAPNYGSTVQSWIDNLNNTKKDPQRVALTFENGSSVKESKFNSFIADGSVSVPTPWFTASAGGSDSHSDSSVVTADDQQNISVVLTYMDKQTVEIQPGKWDIKGKQYNLRSDAPPAVRNLYRPVQLIIISGLGFEITFSGSTVDTVDTKINDSISGHVGLSVCGISFGVGANSESSSESHTAIWSKQDGKLTITARNYGNYANIAAIIGEKVTV